MEEVVPPEEPVLEHSSASSGEHVSGPVSDPVSEPVSEPVLDLALEPVSGGSIVTDMPSGEAVTGAKPKKKPRKPIEKLPCPKCGKKYSKQVFQYRTHKCDPLVFGDDPEEAPPPPEPAVRQTGSSLGDDDDEEGRPFQPPARLTCESLSLLIKQERGAKREAKRRMYASQMF